MKKQFRLILLLILLILLLSELHASPAWNRSGLMLTSEYMRAVRPALPWPTAMASLHDRTISEGQKPLRPSPTPGPALPPLPFPSPSPQTPHPELSPSPLPSPSETGTQASSTAETGTQVSNAAEAAQKHLEEKAKGLRIVEVSNPNAQGTVEGYEEVEVRRIVEQTKAELLSSLQGDELAGTRAAITKLDPLTGKLRKVWTGTFNSRALVTTESATNALNAFSTQLAYLKEGKRSVELKIISTPGAANFYLYGESEEESRRAMTNREPLAVVSTDGGVTVKYRGIYYYVILKDGYKSKEFPLDLWDVKGAKFELQCPLSKDEPVTCIINPIEDKR